MSDANLQQPRTCHYFVDEAGDGTIFNKRKQVGVGREGCSSYFILGVLEVAEPKPLHDSLEALRTELQADPLPGQGSFASAGAKQNGLRIPRQGRLCGSAT